MPISRHSSRLLSSASLYAADLVAYMQPRMGGATPTFSNALTAFKALRHGSGAAHRDDLLRRAARFGQIGGATGKTLNDFSRGFAAIQALYPGVIRPVER